jgi:hypothetical protein
MTEIGPPKGCRSAGVVGVRVEAGGAIHPPLDDVQRLSGDSQSSVTRHGMDLSIMPCLTRTGTRRETSRGQTPKLRPAA